MQNKRTFLISDLHLDEDSPEIAQLFLNLLGKAHEMDALYILGDLFETWIGDDDPLPFYRNIINALQKATKQGLPIYYLHGNRDFLIGKKFFQETGCQLLKDEEKIILYGTPVLLMHGDTLCTRDVKYLKARRRAKNPFLQYLFLSLPLFVRKRIAQNMRIRSKRHKKMIPHDIMDVTPAAVDTVMEKHQVNFLIHGHTHMPCIHPLDNHKTRIVLAAWHKTGHALIWEQTGQKSLVDLDEMI